MANKYKKLSTAYISVLLLMVYLPIFVVMVYSFNSTELFHWEGFTLDWYTKLFSNRTIQRAFMNSVWLAVLSALSAAVIGTIGAVGMARSVFKFKGLVENTSMIPIMIPEIILGMAYLSFFTFLDLPMGMLTLIASHTTFCIPYVYINVKARLVGIDPSIAEAARDLGASKTRTFFDITVPLIAPAIVSGSLLAFAMSFDDVVISFFATGPTTNTLPLYVYSAIKMGVTPEINALCTVMLLFVFCAVGVSRLVLKKS